TLRSSASRDAEAPLHDAIIQNQKPVFNGVQVKPSGVFDQVCQQVIVALQGALDSVHWDSAMQLLPDLPEAELGIHSHRCPSLGDGIPQQEHATIAKPVEEQTERQRDN